MSSDLVCPRCERRLRVSDDVDSRWLTCPRCLASVRNPGFAGSGNPVLDAAPVPVQAPEAGARSCPYCGRAVEAGWRLCPYCDRSLRSGKRARARRVELPDEEALFDGHGVRVALIALGVLLAVGVGLYLTSGALRQVGRIETLVWGMVLALLFGGLLAVRLGIAGLRAEGCWQILGVFAVGAGALMLLVFAACIGVFGTCKGLR